MAARSLLLALVTISLALLCTAAPQFFGGGGGFHGGYPGGMDMDDMGVPMMRGARGAMGGDDYGGIMGGGGIMAPNGGATVLNMDEMGMDA